MYKFSSIGKLRCKLPGVAELLETTRDTVDLQLASPIAQYGIQRTSHPDWENGRCQAVLGASKLPHSHDALMEANYF